MSLGGSSGCPPPRHQPQIQLASKIRIPCTIGTLEIMIVAGLDECGVRVADCQRRVRPTIDEHIELAACCLSVLGHGTSSFRPSNTPLPVLSWEVPVRPAGLDDRPNTTALVAYGLAVIAQPTVCNKQC